jgi:hypothetical protein
MGAGPALPMDIQQEIRTLLSSLNLFDPISFEQDVMICFIEYENEIVACGMCTQIDVENSVIFNLHSRSAIISFECCHLIILSLLQNLDNWVDANKSKMRYHALWVLLFPNPCSLNRRLLRIFEFVEHAPHPFFEREQYQDFAFTTYIHMVCF